MTYQELPRSEAVLEFEKVKKEYEQLCEKGLSLDLSRGKPGKEQLDMVSPILRALEDTDEFISEIGLDVRNYGGLDGIPEMKRIFADLFGLPEKNIIIGGNSSLNLMYDTITRAMMFGVPGSARPWRKQEKIKFLAPSPGYDRHFIVCETLGVELIPVNMTPTGPDMDQVEALVSVDESIKGIWCIPKYSNPDGYTYSDETVDRLANMHTAAPDFRIFWDNAYGVHDFDQNDHDELKDIFSACKEAGNENRILYFASTSKMTFPGAGVAMMAMWDDNLKQAKKLLGAQTIGFDKVNQLRHVRFFKNAANVHQLMEKHAQILRPRFELVMKKLAEGLGGTGCADWTKPKGGYFVSLYTMDGCAENVYQLCKTAGVKLTEAGGAFPYGHNPRDNHLRLAPTYPSLSDLSDALDCLVLCVKYACLNKILNG
ncbi:MAG: aminotransferase class I/II-fold pyridoxal phosphate-dependent enzyme [Clostridia bacterium]|nr:aminotransferase class I/II-fold pyridoxal phosphate-dependent enzyme [Clostridia bacterium]